MASQAYCSPDPTAPVNNPCVNEIAGIIAVSFVKKTYAEAASASDWEDSAWWTAGIASSDIFLILDTKGTYEGPSWLTNDEAYGEAGKEVTGADHEMTYKHKGIHYGTSGSRTNINFYNDLAFKSGEYYAAWVDGQHNLWVSSKPVTALGKPMIAESRKEQQNWEVSVTWSDPEIPQTYDAPTEAYSS